jgi:hypothetical protein
MISGQGARARTGPAWPIRTRASWNPGRGYSFRVHFLFPRNITSMDAYAFALTLGTAGMAAIVGVSDQAARSPATGRGRLHVSAAYSNGIISREPGGAA